MTFTRLGGLAPAKAMLVLSLVLSRVDHVVCVWPWTFLLCRRLTVGMTLAHALQAVFTFMRALKCGLPAVRWSIQSALLGFSSTALIFSKTGAASYSDVVVACFASFIGITCIVQMISMQY